MTRLHRSILIFVVHPKCPNAWSDCNLARGISQHPRKVKLATANFWPACADVSSPPSFFTFKISKRTASRASWSRSISPSLASINIASVSFCCSWSEWFCAWFVVLLRIKSTNSSCLSSPFKSIRFLWFNKKHVVHSKLRDCVLFELVIYWCFFSWLSETYFEEKLGIQFSNSNFEGLLWCLFWTSKFLNLSLKFADLNIQLLRTGVERPSFMANPCEKT